MREVMTLQMGVPEEYVFVQIDHLATLICDPEAQSRPSAHSEALSNMFGWLLLSAGNVTRHEEFAFSTLKVSLASLRRGADYNWPEDPDHRGLV
jgi:hypothetical protein